jgi:RNA polymerase sigma-70 factor (ECF subfamily)
VGTCYKIEPNMDSCIPNASTAPEWQGDDAVDEALLLSADDAEAAENWAGSQSKPTVRARDRILELYDEFRPRLFRYLRSLHLRPDQVDEVIQETFMRLTMQLLKETEIENIQGWIVRVAHNFALTLQKKERRSMVRSEGETFAIENRPDLALSPEEAYSSKEQFKHMNEVLSRLKPQHRQCFQMRAQGLRYKDIGHALGMSEQRAAFVVKQVAVQLAAICG